MTSFDEGYNAFAEALEKSESGILFVYGAMKALDDHLQVGKLEKTGLENGLAMADGDVRPLVLSDSFHQSVGGGKSHSREVKNVRLER